MKKLILILLLLPALLLTACDKEKKEPESTTRAKALAGTYTYTRVGKLNDGNGYNIQININNSGTATITHTDRNFFTITLTHDTLDTIWYGYIRAENYRMYLGLSDSRYEWTYSSYPDYLTFEFYDRFHPEDAGIYTVPFSIRSDEIIYDDLTILVRENYHGQFTTPNDWFIFSGSGLLTLSRQK